MAARLEGRYNAVNQKILVKSGIFGAALASQKEAVSAHGDCDI